MTDPTAPVEEPLRLTAHPVGPEARTHVPQVAVTPPSAPPSGPRLTDQGEALRQAEEAVRQATAEAEAAARRLAAARAVQEEQRQAREQEAARLAEEARRLEELRRVEADLREQARRTEELRLAEQARSAAAWAAPSDGTATAGAVAAPPRPAPPVIPQFEVSEAHRVIDLSGSAVEATAALPVAESGRQLFGMEAKKVSAWFGDHKVLESVSLTIQPGEVTALIGPSGCGKSTFLRILNRMHEMVRGAALAGEVLLDGRDIYEPGRRPAEVRRRIGMVFQRPNPFPAMSIYDNVTSGLKLAGIKSDDKDALVEQSLLRAGLWTEVRNRLDSPGGALSGGQQQRLCIARSLAVQPDVLLMDEPCSALDPTSTRRVEETIAELRGEITVVIVTHNMQQAARVSQSCAFFLATHDTPGHIVEASATEAMFGNPRDQRTSDYVNGRFG